MNGSIRGGSPAAQRRTVPPPSPEERTAQEILQALPAAIYMTDAAGRITFYNEAAAELWGCRPELGKSEFCGSWKLYWPDGTPLPHDQCPMALALQQGRAIRGMEAVAERPDGTRVPFIPYPTPLFDASGRLVGAVNMLVDISERQEAQRAQTRRLETLNRVAHSIARDLDLERIVQTVTDAATELSGARFGAFFHNVTDEQGERYQLYTLSGASREAFETLGLPRNTALFEPTFRGAGIVRSDDIRTDPRYGWNVPHFGAPKGHLPVVSYLAVPVVSRTGAVHGGLFFGHDRPGVFTAEAEGLVAAIASHAAVAIDNARLLQAARVEAEERTRGEQAAQRLAAIVESSEDAIVAKDLNGVIASWNRGAERLFGYTAGEAIGRPITMVIPEDRLDEETEILARIRRGERIEPFETIRRRKDGSLVEISLTISPVRNRKGQIVGASKIARDITERKRAQERQILLLREMNHRVKNLFALAGAVITLSTRNARSPEDLAEQVRNRLGALARAHELTLPDLKREQVATPTTLEALIRTIVLPYEEHGDGRVEIAGPEVAIGGHAVTSLALLLHELATNAAKYGALSTASGSIAVDWTVEDATLSLSWAERGGPPVSGAPGSGGGFGAWLIDGTVDGQLQGRITRRWGGEGLTVRMDLPLDRLTG
ncbi:PAS domain S-box protein [Inquilinus limosus]|uniref:PAS domain S-box protein n=1 Tax=Inquilinus limosus TaxID=171674 RepID=UPI00138AE7E0|nr:PAS domain S-box protein [Inquilinus limosus]